MTPAEYQTILAALSKLLEAERERNKGVEAVLAARISALEGQHRKEMDSIRQLMSHVTQTISREIVLMAENNRKTLEGLPAALAAGIKRSYGPRFDAINARLLDCETATAVAAPQPASSEGNAS